MKVTGNTYVFFNGPNPTQEERLAVYDFLQEHCSGTIISRREAADINQFSGIKSFSTDISCKGVLWGFGSTIDSMKRDHPTYNIYRYDEVIRTYTSEVEL
jgi:hypothetical protein